MSEPEAAQAPSPGGARRRRRLGLLGRAAFALDRTSVLFIGIAVGVTIGIAYAAEHAVSASTSPKAPVVTAGVAGTGSQPIASTGSPADCAAPFSPRLLKTIESGQPISVGVFGDSFGEGIWAALYWTLPKNEHYQVIKFAERSTGFTRYQQLNLEDKAAQDIATQPVDIAVISFGANDTQGIVDGGHIYPLLSPGWKEAYGRRVARFVALLRSEGAMVYWVGLPKMRNPDFDSQIQAMNAFYAGEMAALDVPFMPTEALSVDQWGQFNTFLYDPKEHKDVLMRANDGIHMSIPGYERITGPLVGRIKAYVARSRELAQDESAKTHQLALNDGHGTE
ncbi:MAG TPA: DUF459 domain-containing protein [Caulobacteraceae bacterium]|nr:DUF459 domain-containing protein [Caulobacteraceae bacterium]